MSWFNTRETNQLKYLVEVPVMRSESASVLVSLKTRLATVLEPWRTVLLRVGGETGPLSL